MAGPDQGRCELIEAVRAANGSRKKLRVCRPYKQSVGPRDTLHIPGICAPFSESRLIHIFQGVCPTSSVQFPAWENQVTQLPLHLRSHAVCELDSGRPVSVNATLRRTRCANLANSCW